MSGTDSPHSRSEAHVADGPDLLHARAGEAHPLWPRIIELLHIGAEKTQFARLLQQVRTQEDQGGNRDELIRGIELALTAMERFELLQRRERGLLAVLETAQDLTAIKDPDQVLQAIVQRARKLLGCDVGYLSIYDPGRNDFYVRATDGAFSHSFNQIRVSVDVGVCGYVAKSRQPYASSDYTSDQRFSHASFIDMAMEEERINSILGVPMLAGDLVKGVLFVGDRYSRSYSPWEKQILSVLAAHASVAIENAELFEQKRLALQQAGELNHELAQRNADVDTAARAHEQLTALVARGGGLPRVCEMLAGILDGNVAAFDASEQQIASAVEHAGMRLDLADHKLADALHDALYASRSLGRSVPMPLDNGHYCQVAAVTDGHKLLGGLAISTRTPLRDSEVRTFERGAMVAGIVFLSGGISESSSISRKSALVHSLLGVNEANRQFMHAQAAQFGLDLSRPLQLLLFSIPAGKASRLAMRLARMTALNKAAFDVTESLLAIVLNCESSPDASRDMANVVIDVLGQKVTALVSEPVHDASRLRETYARLEGHLQQVSRLGWKAGIYDEQELALSSLLFGNSVSRELAERYLHMTLGELYQKNSSRRKKLAHTLLVYLNEGHNARAVARELGLHINTVHQRLDTIAGMLDWRDSDRALDIHVALRLWMMQG